MGAAISWSTRARQASARLLTMLQPSAASSYWMHFASRSCCHVGTVASPRPVGLVGAGLDAVDLAGDGGVDLAEVATGLGERTVKPVAFVADRGQALLPGLQDLVQRGGAR